MNNEELNRKMDFIVEQQAQFASDIQQLRESQSTTERLIVQTVNGLNETNEVVTRLARVTHAGFTEVNAKLNAVVDAQIRTEGNIVRLEGNLTRLEGNVTRLEGSVTRLEAKVSQQQDNISRLDENVSRLEVNVSQTSESVRTLKETVETFFKNRRNGN